MGYFRIAAQGVQVQDLNNGTNDNPLPEMPTDRARVVSRSESGVVLALSGEIDISNADALRSYLTACLAEGCTVLTLDLAELSFMDSTGIGSLVGALRELHDRGGRMILRDPQPRVRKVLDLTGISAMTEVVDLEPQ